MSQPNIYVNIDHPASATIQVTLGQTLVLIRSSGCGGKFLHRLDLPASHFAAQPILNAGLTPLPGQPTNTHIVAVGTAQQKGSGNIVVQFAPPNPAYPPYPPSLIPFIIS